MIDSHHHFWHFNEREYGWITPDMSVLRKDFGPAELRAEFEAVSVRGVVSIQARTSIAETDALLSYASENDFVLGVVGWVDLTAPDVGQQLDCYTQNHWLRGIREVCQGAPDEQYFDNPDFNRGVRELRLRNLTYDILLYANQIRSAARFVDRHPDQRFVVDHCAKPTILRDLFPHGWSNDLTELARRENVYCKLSGLATEVRTSDGRWDNDLLQPYLDAVLNAFGPRRLMFGSDWPVCLLATSYQRWFAACETLVDAFSSDERAAIFEETARQFYRLNCETTCA